MSTPPSLPRQLQDIAYTKFRRILLKTKGSDKQKVFLEHVRDTNSFIALMSKIETVGNVDMDLTPWPLTESEFKDPPIDTERAIYKSWSRIPPAVACRSTFWACLTLEHIRHGRIQSVYLAANGGALSGGAERIDLVLNDSTARAPQRIDSCVRTVLRRLGGLPEVRGNRSVYVDCPFARSWWRERMAREAARDDPHLLVCARTILRLNQTYWEKFIDRVVFRNSTFGSVNIRNAFICALGDRFVSNPSSNLRETKTLQRLCRRATAYQGSLELSILKDEELDNLMRSIVESVPAS